MNFFLKKFCLKKKKIFGGGNIFFRKKKQVGVLIKKKEGLISKTAENANFIRFFFYGVKGGINTPQTSNAKTKINIGSKIKFNTRPVVVAIKVLLECPAAVSIPVNI